MTAEELVAAYPRLYHGTLPENVAGIRRHGLHTTAELLRDLNVDAGQKSEITAAPRPRPTTLRSGRRMAVLRDQTPLCQQGFQRCLTDVSVPEWLNILNKRVYFWPTEKRLEAHLSAKANRLMGHHVFEIDTDRLIRTYEKAIELSPINSGSAIRRAAPRGSQTFQKLDEYDFAARKKSRGRANAVAEVTVRCSLPDFVKYVIAERVVAAS